MASPNVSEFVSTYHPADLHSNPKHTIYFDSLDPRQKLDKVGKGREMEYIEQTTYNTFYPFQNNHQIHWHDQSVKMLCAFKIKNLVCIEMGKAN